jgi:large subunit ribosomal protein L9
MAVRATAENLNELELRRKAEQREEKRERKKFSAKAEEIDGYNLMLTVRAGEEGKLFGSVTTLDIANGVEEGLGVEIDRRSVMLEEPIKELGTYSVTIKLYDDITADIKVDVMAER